MSDEDFSYLIGKKPPPGPGLNLERCGCGLIVGRAPCLECTNSRNARRMPMVAPRRDQQLPMVVLGILLLFGVGVLSTSMDGAPERDRVMTVRLD